MITLRRRLSSDLRQRLADLHHPSHSFSIRTFSQEKDGFNSGTTKLGPPPIQVSLTESAGRGVFATRRIGAGELIHTANPLVTHPTQSGLDRPQVCCYCLRRLGMRDGVPVTSAPNGGFWYFCSDACKERAKVFVEVERRADWSFYDEHCSMRQLKYPFMVKRLACMVISGGASVDCLDILQPAYLHPQTILEMEKEFELLKATFLKAQIDDELIAFLTKRWYTGALARLHINSFRIELIGGSYESLLASAAAIVEGEAAVGNAVYMLPSFYNHDCDPNVNILWIENADAKIRALRDIEAGEELCICYIDASMDCKARQVLLADGFGFQCHCLRCKSGD
ncbi:histone-lysine N-methyltransferase ATXR4 isoform X1 [Dioscorea cayenensis subsp. rotundata]|uniref:Histone-lysine N-methyltransferase ATXR4 isoform X1 n=1 Tax=Dioscorea cayennensis subsp. rotundata TaxID=55577 RepID=A0AB40APD7_DIOCR|nr:histone-lysine N-methyltransferase ATXR4 isoform X1 [Dioscorea cayenensis subsp. rotundata]